MWVADTMECMIGRHPSEGVNHETGRPYETELCDGTEPMGLMLLSDSAGAHFHIPAQYFQAADITKGTLSHLPYIIENEFDWPMLSAATGYRNITWSIVDNFTESVYVSLRQRNLCNHRDYQNLGVNGADSGNFLKYWESVKRNQISDYPVLVLYVFSGNDVCNGHEDTLADMTTPEEMRERTLKILDKLNSTIPFGSHVLMMGLANGSYLWQSLHNRLHPFGRLNKDIDYPQFYEYLTCVGKNPCNGWMTANETLRNLTSTRAFELSNVLEKIALESQHRYRNFDIAYIENPFNECIAEWVKIHGEDSAWQLIEPVDGFHPNKLGNILFAKVVWKYLLDNQTHFIGKVNPNNQLIVNIFGDQGGH